MNNLSKTINFVTKCHDGQFRKGNLKLPYIVHPYDVMRKLVDWGVKDDNTLIASFAHDVLEECSNITFNDLKEEIGLEAATIVQELTFIPNKNSKLKTSEQKAEYILSIGEKSIQSLAIKIADRISNTLDFYDSGDWKYARIYFDKALSLFTSLANRKEECENYFSYNVYENIFKNRTDVCRLLQEKESILIEETYLKNLSVPLDVLTKLREGDLSALIQHINQNEFFQEDETL